MGEQPVSRRILGQGQKTRRVKLNGKRYDAGYFDNEQEAAEAARLLRERLGVK